MMESMDKGLTAPNAPKFLQLFLPTGLKVLDIVEKRLHRVSIVHAWANYKDSFIRPGRFRLLECEQDSKELSPRSLDKMLLKRQVNSQNVQSTFKFSKSSKFSKIICMIFKHI